MYRMSNHLKRLKGNHDLVVLDEITDKHQYILSHDKSSSLAWSSDSHVPNCSRIRFRPSWADPPFGNVARTIPFR